MRKEFWAALVAVATLAGFGGCGDPLYPVKGTLVWEDGQPAKELAGAMLYFESADLSTVSRSAVEADGQFQLTTETPQAEGPDGVPPGEHRVYVVDGLPSKVHPRFRRPATSGLTVTVPPDGPVVLKLVRAPAAKTTQRAPTRQDES
jgi:hypothetical protein